MSRGVLTRVLFVLMAILTLVPLTAVPLGKAQAADLTWDGYFRSEAIWLKNPELASSLDSNKAYLLNHMVLMPKLVAADGVAIYGRLDILNDPAFGNSSTAGSALGEGPGDGSPSNVNDSNALARAQASDALRLTSVYLSWSQEFGQLIIGRVPIQFGMGLNYSAGAEVFDHFIDTKDLVGYKVVLGNLSFMPMFAKTNEGNIGEADDVDEYIVQVMYENPDTELSLGFMYDMKVATFAGNDYPISTTPSVATPGNVIGSGDVTGNTVTRIDGYKNTLLGLYATQMAGPVRISAEAGMFSGDTGIATNGVPVTFNAFGLATEIAYAPVDSKLLGTLKAGIASGDNPGTPDVFEGFTFNRNYNVGLLLGNHPLGQANILRTDHLRGTKPVRNEIDSDTVSNMIYLAPGFQYALRDNLSWGGTFIYAMLNEANAVRVDTTVNPATGTVVSTDSTLGYELDLNVTFKPMERITWVTEAGVLFPGSAWSVGPAGFGNDVAFALTTKAAISF